MGTDSDVQAAHILPQKCSDQFPRSGGLHDAMATAGLANLYDTCNGFLLCDQCHDFFDAYLWSVDSEQVVVMSNALTANVPSLAAFSGKQLFPDNTAASLVARMNRPLPGVWVWHFQAFKSATAARHANAALDLFDCSRCKKRYVQEWRKDKHEATCLAVRVPAKHYFTPATKQGSAASGGGGAAAGGGGGGGKRRRLRRPLLQLSSRKRSHRGGGACYAGRPGGARGASGAAAHAVHAASHGARRARSPPDRCASPRPARLTRCSAAALVGPYGPARALQPPAARWCGASRAAQ